MIRLVSASRGGQGFGLVQGHPGTPAAAGTGAACIQLFTLMTCCRLAVAVVVSTVCCDDSVLSGEAADFSSTTVTTVPGLSAATGSAVL